MVAQAVAMRMASTFADQWQRVLYKTPELDANIGNPVSSIGGQVFQDIRTAEREEALVSAAADKGFLFVFQDEASCAVCPVQSRVIGDLRDRFGIRVLAVSMDGSATPEFPTPLADQGQIERLGLTDYPRPTLALVDPQTDEVTIIGSGLLTQDVVLERVNVLTRYAPGERYTNEDFRANYGGASSIGRPEQGRADNQQLVWRRDDDPYVPIHKILRNPHDPNGSVHRSHRPKSDQCPEHWR